MITFILSSALALAAQANTADYEGVARDSFAAWSFTSGSVAMDGNTRTTSVMTRYNTPTPFNGNPTPITYSIHRVSIDCAARTVTWISGANYSTSGVEVNPAAPAAAAPWTDGTSGFQSLAAQVCAMNAPL